jgi:hypothetical protein
MLLLHFRMYVNLFDRKFKYLTLIPTMIKIHRISSFSLIQRFLVNLYLTLRRWKLVFKSLQRRIDLLLSTAIIYLIGKRRSFILWFTININYLDVLKTLVSVRQGFEKLNVYEESLQLLSFIIRISGFYDFLNLQICYIDIKLSSIFLNM